MKKFYLELLGLGVVILAILLISSVIFGSFQFDLTKDKRYTLSEGSKEILSSLENPVNIYFFYSEDLLKNTDFAKQAEFIKLFLKQYELASKGQIKINYINPKSFSELEDRAIKYGIAQIPVGSGEYAYLGLGLSSRSQELAIPFLDENRQAFLEYDITQAIYNVSLNKPPVIGVISFLPIYEGIDPKTGKNIPEILLYNQLRFSYDVRRLATDFSYINPEIELLILIQPESFSQSSLYLLEQFVFRGGKLIILADPFTQRYTAEIDADIIDGDFLKLISNWGISFDNKMIVADKNESLLVMSKDNQQVRHYGLLGITKEYMNSTSFITGNLNRINMSSVGLFSFSPKVKVEKLLMSSRDYLVLHRKEYENLLMKSPTSQVSFYEKPDQMIFAAKVNASKVKSMINDFPKIKQIDEKHIQTADMIELAVIADTNFIADGYYAKAERALGEVRYDFFADNANFMLNLVDNMLGKTKLSAIRKDASIIESFSLLEKIKKQAMENMSQQSEKLEKNLEKKEKELQAFIRKNPNVKNTLNSKTDTLSQQKKALEQDLFSYREQLRDIRYSLDNEIKKIGTIIKIINIFVVPILVGLILWFVRRKFW